MQNLASIFDLRRLSSALSLKRSNIDVYHRLLPSQTPPSWLKSQQKQRPY